ncbi:MAG: DUF4252 domain-containing protein [Gammaproteobacteria bacterium]
MRFRRPATVRRYALAPLLAALVLPACGLTAPRGSDGFADLDSLGALDVDNTLTLSIGPTLLRFAARHMDETDAETRALLEGLDGVRVRIYEIDGDAGRVARRMDRMSQGLQAEGWAPVALMRDPGGEQVHMLMKSDGDHIAGLTVISSDGSEAVIVNVMGELHPALFSPTMAALSVDAAPAVRVAAADPGGPSG